MKILVVDDEPYILEGICELLRREEQWEVYQALSAGKAMAILDRQRMDIVLTDICMSGMDGLALLTEIHNRWPFCKVILLSAHGSFEFARTAMQKGAFAYLMKTDGDAAILKEVKACSAVIEQELAQVDDYEGCKRRAEEAFPLLQNAALLNILEWMPAEAAQKELAAYGIDLDISKPLLLIVAKIDGFTEDSNSHQRFQLMLQVIDIFEKYLSPKFSCYHATLENKNMVWILQTENDRNSSLVYCRQVLEMVQESALKALSVSLSIIYDEFLEFSELHVRYRQLHSILLQTVIQGEERILADSRFYTAQKSNELEYETGSSNTVLNMEALKIALLNGDGESFRDSLKSILNQRENVTAARKLKVYHEICSMMLEHIDNIGLDEEIFLNPEFFDIFISYHGRKMLYKQLGTLAEDVISHDRKKWSSRAEGLIQSIHNCIKANLAGDLSLQSIADKFYLNPAYLSRFYKQHTGTTLSETITGSRMALAKKMLEKQDIKISQIARDTGYESAAYFTRVFRKREGMSPQEWREKNIQGSERPH